MFFHNGCMESNLEFNVIMSVKWRVFLQSLFSFLFRETMAFGEAFKEQLLAEEDDDERRRLAELKRRNTLYPSHLQSSYPM